VNEFPVRSVDGSFGGRCPSCAATLPKIVRLQDVTEVRTIEVPCGCGFTVVFTGQGLIRDRRRARQVAPEGLDKRLEALRPLTY
jgi:hypothetical protein